MKTLHYLVIAIVVFIWPLTQCTPVRVQAPPVDHNLKITVVSDTDSTVTASNGEPRLNLSMEVPNQEGSLSRMSFILKDEAFIKLYSALTVGDVSNLWNDFSVLEKLTDIREVNLFINSPGGDAFSGLALADQIERAKRKGFHITVHASGIVASAAVPVFAVADRRLAAPGTIFMVHEASIWKWPGRETASDIRAQNRLMELIRDRYLGKLAFYTNMSKDEWGELEMKTTWFSAEQAKIWGLVDEIE